MYVNLQTIIISLEIQKILLFDGPQGGHLLLLFAYTVKKILEIRKQNQLSESLYRNTRYKINSSLLKKLI